MISQEAWIGNYNGEFRFNSWPHYGRPSSVRWVIWRSILMKVFIHRGRRLRLPLGDWKREDPDWQWFSSKNGLYRRIKGSWFYHRPLIRRQRLPAFSQQGIPWIHPHVYCHTSVYSNRGKLVSTGSARILNAPTYLSRSFQQMLVNDSTLHWCLHKLAITDDAAYVAQSIIETDAFAISDGSFQDTYGTAAWLVKGNVGSNTISGCVLCPGLAEDHSSYRSELSGFYALVSVVNSLCSY
jgi:hypothetical protein